MPGSSPPARWSSRGPHQIATAVVGGWTVVDGTKVAVLARYHREQAA